MTIRRDDLLAPRQPDPDRARAAEAQFAAIVAISADAIISVDEDQRIIDFNAGAEQIFGWQQPEILGQPLDLLLPERFRVAHREHIRRFAESPIPARRMGERREIAGLRRNGEEFPADASISKIDIQGRMIFTVVLRDISERKRAERAQRFLARAGSVLAASLDYETTLASITRLAAPEMADWCVVYVLERDGAIRRHEVAHADPARNEMLQALRGLALDRGRPHPVFDAIDTAAAAQLPEIGEDELRAMARDRSQLVLYHELGMRSAVVIPLIARGQLLGAMGFFSGEPHHFDEDDVIIAQELAIRAALAIDNARLYREAQDALRARDDVLAIVSHDLGNPLSAIRIGTTLLLRAIPEHERDSGGWQHLETIRQSSAQMERLINDLIEAKRIEAGKLELVREPHRPGTLLAETVEMFGPIAGGKGIELETQIGRDISTVEVDRERTLQVLSNLVGNAIKFTSAGGRITLSTRRADNGEGLFAVADTGSGIAPEHLEHIFDRFWQVQRGRGEGIGLGLAICRGIVQAQGGRIWAESEPGQGTTVFFTVPAGDGGSD